MPPQRSPRLGAMNLSTMVVLSLMLLLLLVGLLVLNSRRTVRGDVRQLFVYCAAGMRYPMELIVADYQREYDVVVHCSIRWFEHVAQSDGSESGGRSVPGCG